MNRTEFEAAWAAVLPEIVAIAERFRTHDNATDAEWQVYASYYRQCREACFRYGLEITTLAPSWTPETPTEEIVRYWRAASYYSSCPDHEWKAEVQWSSERLLRINAPSWYQHPEFVRWLNSPGTATWHISGNEPSEGSDAFFTCSVGEGGTDYPGNAELPGIPEEIWEYLEFLAADECGDDAEVLVWVSNLDI